MKTKTEFSPDAIHFDSKRAVVVSSFRAFLHGAAIGAVLTAGLGAGKAPAIVVGIVVGLCAFPRSKRVGAVLDGNDLYVNNYWRTIRFSDLATVSIHRYSRNRLELRESTKRQTLVQAANYWNDTELDRFLSELQQRGARDVATIDLREPPAVHENDLNN